MDGEARFMTQRNGADRLPRPSSDQPFAATDCLPRPRLTGMLCHQSLRRFPSHLLVHRRPFLQSCLHLHCGSMVTAVALTRTPRQNVASNKTHRFQAITNCRASNDDITSWNLLQGTAPERMHQIEGSFLPILLFCVLIKAGFLAS